MIEVSLSIKEKVVEETDKDTQFDYIYIPQTYLTCQQTTIF